MGIEIVGDPLGGSEKGTAQRRHEIKDVDSRRRSWSYSSLKDYEACPQRIKLKLDKAPVLPQEENRGTTVHRLCEEYVKGEIDELPRDLRKFEEQFVSDRECYLTGAMELEQEWGYDQDWQQASWFEAWLRVKCDQVVHLSDTELRIVDYKTGKRFGNEVPHLQQAQLYALAAFMRYPNIESIETEMRYLDHGEVTRKLWSRAKDCVRLLEQYTKRVRWMQIDNVFKPNPNKMNCRWCKYGISNGSNACGHAVEG